MSERPCNECIWRTFDGCTRWDCEPVTRHEAKKLLKSGYWTIKKKRKFIDLEHASEQYTALGYPHINILNLECSNCKKVTMVNDSILYEFCPHCGVKMEEVVRP